MLKRAYKILDEEFFEGTLASFFKRKKFPIEFAVSRTVNNTNAQCEFSGVMTFFSDSINHWYEQSQLNEDNVYTIDGIPIMSKKELVVHILGHELVHAIIFASCTTTERDDIQRVEGGHGEKFVQLARRIFGHRHEKKGEGTYHHGTLPVVSIRVD
jgi:hypothetical protein